MEITQGTLKTLYTSFSTIFKEAMDSKVEPRWPEIATKVPSSTAANEYGWMNKIPGLREWVGSRVLKEVSASAYTIKNQRWEDTIRVNRTDIEDDNIGLYRPLIEALALAAREHVDKLVFDALKKGHEALCYDGQYFFDDDHPAKTSTGTISNILTKGATETDGNPWYMLDTNQPIKPLIFQNRQAARFGRLDSPDSDHTFMNDEFVYGVDARYAVGYSLPQLAMRSRAPLTEANLERGIAQMATWPDDNGQQLGIMPNVIVVGASNQFKAAKILEAMQGSGGSSNIHYQRLQIVVAPRLA